MLPSVGIVPSRQNGRRRWSEARLSGQRFHDIRLVLLVRSRPPPSTISSARDEPYRWEHLREAFSTLRYLKVQCCTRHDLPLSPAIWLQNFKAEIAGDTKRDPERCNRSGMNSGACRSHSPHVHTARDRPHSTKWSRMAPGGASLMCAIFMCVLGPGTKFQQWHTFFVIGPGVSTPKQVLAHLVLAHPKWC